MAQGLKKPRVFQGTGQLESTLVQPPPEEASGWEVSGRSAARRRVGAGAAAGAGAGTRCSAVQVAFESKGLKPGFHFLGSRVETRRFQAMGLNCTQRVQPPPRSVVGGGADGVVGDGVGCGGCEGVGGGCAGVGAGGSGAAGGCRAGKDAALALPSASASDASASALALALALHSSSALARDPSWRRCCRRRRRCPPPPSPPTPAPNFAC
jgi:hypothetical protein